MEKMGKFSLLFDIAGDGPATLNKAVDSLKDMGDEAEKTREKLGGLADAMISEKIAGFADQMMGLGKSGFMMFADQFKQAVMTVMPLESALQRIASATKLGQVAARGILEDFLQLASKTPFTEEQVIGLGMALTQSKVSLDAFTDKAGKALTVQDALNEGWAKGNKELIEQSESLKSLKLTSLTMLGDLASMQGKTGQQMDFFIRAFQKSLATGQLQSLAGDITPQQKAAIFGTTGGTSKVSAQQAMNNLFTYLKKEGQIGAMAAGGATMEGLMSTLKDIPGQLYRNILGMPGSGGLYDRIKKGFAELVDKLGAYFSDPKFLGSVKEALEPIATFLLMLAETAKKLGLAILQFVKENPKVTKVIANFLFFGSILLFLVGGIVAVAGALAGLTAVWGLLGGVIMTAMGPALGIVLAFAAAVGVMVGLGYLLYNAYVSNFGGLNDVITKTFLVFKGLYELISSLSGVSGEMSEETATALENAGLMEFVVDLFGYFVRFKTFFEGMFESLSINATNAMQMIQPAIDSLGRALDMLFASLGGVMKALGATVSADDLDRWQLAGQVIGMLIAPFEMMAIILSGIINVVTTLIDLFLQLPKAIGAVGNALSFAWNHDPLLQAMVHTAASALGFGGEATPALAAASPVGMSMETPEMMQSNVSSRQLTGVKNAVSAAGNSRPTEITMASQVVELHMDSEKVGQALIKNEQRNKYLSHE